MSGYKVDWQAVSNGQLIRHGEIKAVQHISARITSQLISGGKIPDLAWFQSMLESYHDSLADELDRVEKMLAVKP